MGEKRLGNKAVAHIRKADGKKQTLEEHLLSVSGLTGTFARKIGLSQSGELAGGSHDFGKYAEAFRQYILSANGAIDPGSDEYIDPVSHKGKIDHSTAGAQYVRKRLVREKYPLYAQMMFLSICSHHSGLIDCLLPDGGNGFDKRLNKKEEDTHLAECESKADPAVKNLLASLSEEEILMEWYLKCRSIERREKKFAARAENPAAVSEEYENTRFFKKGLLLRCFFSCLLDADRIDSACFEDEQYKALRKRLGNPDWPKLAGHLEKALSAFSRESVIGRLRCDIADACYARSRSARGIYTLTVPTGGGKTLSSLRFAIHHAREHQLERIVYVIPYTSIIEQNAKVVRDILEKDEEPGTIVLEHHSNHRTRAGNMAGKAFIVQLGNAGGIYHHGAVSGNPVRFRDGFRKTHAQSGQCRSRFRRNPDIADPLCPFVLPCPEFSGRRMRQQCRFVHGNATFAGKCAES